MSSGGGGRPEPFGCPSPGGGLEPVTEPEHVILAPLHCLENEAQRRPLALHVEERGESPSTPRLRLQNTPVANYAE